METLCLDFLEWLGPDTSTTVLTLLDDFADLVRVCAVSKSWRRFGVCSSNVKSCPWDVRWKAERQSVATGAKEGEGSDGLRWGGGGGRQSNVGWAVAALLCAYLWDRIFCF